MALQPVLKQALMPLFSCPALLVSIVRCYKAAACAQASTEATVLLPCGCTSCHTLHLRKVYTDATVLLCCLAGSFMQYHGVAAYVQAITGAPVRLFCLAEECHVVHIV